MPKGWRFPESADLWMPLRFDEKKETRGQFFLNPIGRLKPGVTLEQANAELAHFAEMEAREHPDVNKGSTVRAVPMREAFSRDAKTLTLLLMGAVLFVHLIACANTLPICCSCLDTANKEFDSRMALGANRSRVVRQLLIESALIGIAGAAGGLIIAVWGIDLMVSMISVPLPFWLRFDLDYRVFFFAVSRGLVFGLLFRWLPPRYAFSRPNPDGSFEGGRTATGGMRESAYPLISSLSAEVAIRALVLLIGAGLMMRSFLKLQHLDAGIEAKNLP